MQKLLSDNKKTDKSKGQRYYIYRASIKLKDGTINYAKTYGKKAFRIPITKIS